MIVIWEKFAKVWTNSLNLIENLKVFKKNLEKFNENLKIKNLKLIKSCRKSNSALKIFVLGVWNVPPVYSVPPGAATELYTCMYSMYIDVLLH